MTDITPPPELVQQWLAEAKRLHSRESTDFIAGAVARLAYQAGADQELEACCHYFARDLRESLALELRAARRPKPPSLKEQALTALTRYTTGETILTNESVDTIRRALEQLPE